MSSEHRAPAQMPANKLYVNIASIVSSIVDTNLSTVAWADDSIGSITIPGLLSTPGAAVLRDMGKTVYLPAGSTSASVSTVLRKVQLVAPGTAGGVAGEVNMTGAGAGDYLTGYIQLGGMTYGGGNGVPTRVARLN
jgi:hypothetical protein